MVIKYKKPKISIVIPFLNEAKTIQSTCRYFSSSGACEVILVDGGSTDGSIEKFESFSKRIILIRHHEANRAEQMNAGAKIAKGSTILFCHSDMRLPLHWDELINNKIRQGFNAGGFLKEYDSSSLLMKVYAFLLNNVYLRCFKKLVGTNGIFIKKELFWEIGGYDSVPILEDVLLSQKILRKTPIAIIEEKVMVSGRRYMYQGVISQLWVNFRVIWGHMMNKSPHELKKIYYKIDHPNKHRNCITIDGSRK